MNTNLLKIFAIKALVELTAGITTLFMVVLNYRCPGAAISSITLGIELFLAIPICAFILFNHRFISIYFAMFIVNICFYISGVVYFSYPGFDNFKYVIILVYFIMPIFSLLFAIMMRLLTKKLHYDEY